MSTTTSTSTSKATSAAGEASAVATNVPWRAGIAAGLAAAVATTAVAATADAAGHAATVAGEPIPVLAFAQLTFIATLLGLGLAAVISRLAAHPRRVFVVATIALTAATLVPDATADATLGTKLLLMSTHVLAAAIVIPVIARRLRRTRVSGGSHLQAA